MIRVPHRALLVVTTLLVAAGCVRKPTDTTALEGGADAASATFATAVTHDDSGTTFPKTSALPLDAGVVDAAAMAARGKDLYGRYCNFCHGDTGRGYAADEAPAIASDDFLTLASDDFLRAAINKGRPGTTMSAWSVARGGPVGDNDATAIISHLRSWQKAPSVTLTPRPAGNPARGQPLYTKHCQSCHGAGGVNGKYANLSNAELLAVAKDEYLAATISRGRSGTPMPAFGEKLSAAEIDDVVALLRSWQKPPEETPALPPKPGALTDVVLHPKGPAPVFPPTPDFVPVDVVKEQLLGKKATMILVDARAPGDYARMHIAGAISVPFYDVDKYAPQIPKDRFILTYCACPHAASVKARDAFRRLGYTNVAVLDEGILAWRDRGYPVRGGPKP